MRQCRETQDHAFACAIRDMRTAKKALRRALIELAKLKKIPDSYYRDVYERNFVAPLRADIWVARGNAHRALFHEERLATASEYEARAVIAAARES